ncbi:MAG TPA: hypothetical protein VGF76_12990 [Polyangiaceae bacterium]|jgi:hypothetical protein
MRGYAALVFLLLGCSGRNASTTAALQPQSGAAECTYPAGVQTDAGALDTCSAGPPGQICEVSNGATIDADGAVESGTKTCTPQCDSGQYELVCQSRAPELSAPSPGESLGCTGTKIRSPGPGPNVGLYCCPCAN